MPPALEGRVLTTEWEFHSGNSQSGRSYDFRYIDPTGTSDFGMFRPTIIALVFVGLSGCSFFLIFFFILFYFFWQVALLLCYFDVFVQRGCIQVSVSVIQTIADFLMYKKGENGLSEEGFFVGGGF